VPAAPSELEKLLDELERAPQSFDFFQALRLLECATAPCPRLGESAKAKDDAVRLGQEPSLNFAPRTIASLQRNPQGGSPRLEVFFFGLFGPNGPMPLHLTEYVRNRLHQAADPTLARFADIFHHRLLSLFYRAWANAQPTTYLDRPENDRFSGYVGSLLGIGSLAMVNRDQVPDHTKLYFSGLLSSGARHPSGLKAIIEEYFGLPVRIDEFVGRWTEIPESSRCILSELSSSRLGVSSTIGSDVWDCQQTFRVAIGPLTLEDYRRLLPGGRNLGHLVDLVRNYIGEELMWELQLIVLKDETPPTILGKTSHLGLTTWLEPETLPHDADDFHWNPQLDPDLPAAVAAASV
jgi:type VI secretion system protein ImpH